MAARKRRVQMDDAWKGRIQASMLINRLNDNAMGKLPLEMTSGQIKAAEIVLRKMIPDLSAVEQTTEISVNYVAAAPEIQPDKDKWLQQHAPATIQ